MEAGLDIRLMAKDGTKQLSVDIRDSSMRLILLIIGLILLIWTASATDYYVSTIGDNSNDGLSIVNAKYNFSNSDWFNNTNIKPGDTVYVINGTWEGEELWFTHSTGNILYVYGNDTHDVTIKAYNGTPTFNDTEVMIYFGASPGTGNIKIEDLKFHSFGKDKCIYVRDSDKIHISNVEISASYSGSGGAGVSFINSSNCSVIDSNLHDVGWNLISISSGTSAGANASNFLIQNNTLIDSPGTSGGTGHASVDLYPHAGSSTTLVNISIIRNEMARTTAAIYMHPEDIKLVDMNISDNIVYSIPGTGGIALNGLGENAVVSNNTISDQLNGFFIDDQSMSIYSFNIDNNTCINVTNPATLYTNVANIITATDNDFLTYQIRYGNLTVINPKNTSFHLKTPYNDGSKIKLQYNTNDIFTENGANDTRYYNDRSEYITTGIEDVTIVTSNVTLKPASGYGKDIVVNTDLVDDVSNVTANVSTLCNVLINFTVVNVSNTYNFSVNDIFNYSVISGSDSIARFNYTFTSSTPTDFKVTWSSEEGWSYVENSIYEDVTFRIDTDGDITQVGTPIQENTNLTGLFGVVIT